MLAVCEWGSLQKTQVPYAVDWALKRQLSIEFLLVVKSSMRWVGVCCYCCEQSCWLAPSLEQLSSCAAAGLCEAISHACAVGMDISAPWLHRQTTALMLVCLYAACKHMYTCEHPPPPLTPATHTHTHTHTHSHSHTHTHSLSHLHDSNTYLSQVNTNFKRSLYM